MKKLKTLLNGLSNYEVFGSKEVSVSEITNDSRNVQKLCLFVAILGVNFDAHKFIPGVISKGALVVVGEKKPSKSWLDKITYIKVPNSRRALGLLASAWYDYPSKRLKTIGVTGTDGKTTTSSLIYFILHQAGKRVGLVTSISAKIGTKELDTGFHVTNPEPLALQQFLARMVDAKCKYAVLEVTSHGLDQERVAGINFDVGVLTNITHEHLDYHKTWLKYLEAKSKLFRKVVTAILNKDDIVVYDAIKCEVPSRAEVISYGIDEKSADYLGKNIKRKRDGTEFDVLFESRAYRIKTKLLGDYNLSNVLAACAVARTFKIPWKKIQSGVSSFKSPIGRLEEIKSNYGFKVYVDFAHTPNSLENVLSFLARRKKRRLMAVFGCAGERDVAKRAMMGEIAGRLADISVFTAEDPRSEDANDIIGQMVAGVRRVGAKEFYPARYSALEHCSKNNCFVRVPERGEAIAFAIQKLAKKGDVIGIFGKGHEKSMAYDGVEHPWSDHEAARIALKGGVKRIRRR